MSKSSVQHFKPLPDGRIGCYQFGCDEPAARWADFEHHGQKRFLSTAYCDSHGELELRGPKTTERKIRQSPKAGEWA